nr:hypothetical protein [Cohnella faecalis]
MATLRTVRQHGLPDWIVKAGSGVHEPQDAVDFMRAGADAVLLGSGFVFAGPGLPKRVNDAIQQERLQAVPEMPPPSFWRNWGWIWLLGIAMIAGGLAAWFIAGTTVLLPYDEDYLGMTGERLTAFNEHLLHFMSHDRITLAGTMLSLGILYYRLARYGIGQGRHWARTAVTISCAVVFPAFFSIWATAISTLFMRRRQSCCSPCSCCRCAGIRIGLIGERSVSRTTGNGSARCGGNCVSSLSGSLWLSAG